MIVSRRVERDVEPRDDHRVELSTAEAGATVHGPSSARGVTRRTAIALAATAAALGFGGGYGLKSLTDADHNKGPLPFYSGPAATIHAGRRTPPLHASVNVIWSGPSDSSQVSLTFDDGPLPQWTPRVLETLAEKNAVATFFVRGDHLSTHHDVLRPYRGIHEFGNHTWDHPDLGRLDYHGCVDQLTRTNAAMEQLLGIRPTLMRPPYGHMAGATLLACNDLNLTPVLWSRQMLETNFRNDPTQLATYMATAVQPGDIVLAHDTNQDDHIVAINELGRIIDVLRDSGLELVTVSQLLAGSVHR